MHYYNAVQAARYIGVDPKTVRRWLKKGLLTAERTEQGWLAIPGGQVEYAKIKWEEEQAKFARPWLSKDTTGGAPDASLGRLPNEYMDSIRQLEDRIVYLEEIVLGQNERIASLEKALSNASLGIPTQPQAPLHRYIVDREEATSHKPTEQPSDASSSIPGDWTLCSDFFSNLNIKETTWRRFLANGISGENFEFEEKPVAAGTSKKYRYFNPEQQKKAVSLLRKHGKLQ